jgi:hypothetical protein
MSDGDLVSLYRNPHAVVKARIDGARFHQQS